MNVAFRPARDSDRKVFDWRPYGPDRRRPSVVTVNGKVALMVGENRTVLFQYGGGGVPDLLRAQARVWAALGEMTFADRDALKRQGREPVRLLDVP